MNTDEHGEETASAPRCSPTKKEREKPAATCNPQFLLVSVHPCLSVVFFLNGRCHRLLTSIALSVLRLSTSNRTVNFAGKPLGGGRLIAEVLAKAAFTELSH